MKTVSLAKVYIYKASLALAVLLFLIPLGGLAQQTISSSAAEEAQAAETLPGVQLDSLPHEDGNYLLQVTWMDTTFQLLRKHSSFVEAPPIPKEDNSLYAIYREKGWDGEERQLPYSNCHTFGLAQAFSHAGLNPRLLFNPTTFVSPEALEALLKVSFREEGKLDATSMADLQEPVPPGCLLVFRDEQGKAIHTAFQGEEGLFSKNGRFEPRLYHQLFDVKKVYYMTTSISLYRLKEDTLGKPRPDIHQQLSLINHQKE